MYHNPTFEPTRDEMFAILEKNISFHNRTELVPAWEADRRVAAENLKAAYPLPNRPASAFDGIAVRFSDFTTGAPDTSQWIENRDYAFSNTGVAIPDEFDTVIAIEDVERHVDGTISVNSVPDEKGAHVNPVGCQISSGECLVTRGEMLHPVSLGILFAAGYQSVPVFVRPKVLFLPTGDELVPSGGTVSAGMNVESNSIMLTAMIRRFGGIPSVSRILPDEPEIIKKAILEGIHQADLVVIGAGSSKGSKDFTMDVLEEIGTVLVQELGVAPGKHCSLTMVDETPVMGIPGPPGGAQLICQYYIKAAIELIMLGKRRPTVTLPAVLTEDISGKWIDFMHPVELFHKDKVLFARPQYTVGKSRAESRNVLQKICYCPKGENLHKGDTVSIEIPCLISMM